MAKSIMQNTKECYITGSTINLHKHHVFFGSANRSKSEKWGCWVWLRSDFHNTSDYSIHFDRVLDLWLKRDTQRQFEQLYSREKFMEIFGKNYLEECQ